MDKKKRNSIIAIIISLVLFAGIILVLVFFGSDGRGQVGPVARWNIAAIIVAGLTALGLGASRAKPKRFEMSKDAILGLAMLAIFSFLALMIWLSSDLNVTARIVGVVVISVIALPLLFFGIRMRRRAQSLQRYSWATFMIWLGSIAAVFFVASLIQVLVP